MNEFLHDWIMGLTGAAVLTSAAQLLTPKGPVEKVTKYVCAMMLAAVLLSPVLNLELYYFEWPLAEYRQTVEELTNDLEADQSAMIRTYIEEQCAAYILDEAQVIGIADGRVEVSALWAEETWIPQEATMIMKATIEQRRRLGSYITSQLGIPPERQMWYDP